MMLMTKRRLQPACKNMLKKDQNPPEAMSVRRERLSQDLVLHCLPWTQAYSNDIDAIDVHDVHGVHGVHNVDADEIHVCIFFLTKAQQMVVTN